MADDHIGHYLAIVGRAVLDAWPPGLLLAAILIFVFALKQSEPSPVMGVYGSTYNRLVTFYTNWHIGRSPCPEPMPRS